MIKAEDVIKSVMGDLNDMNKTERRAYLDRIGFKYTLRDSGKAGEKVKIKKIDSKHSRGSGKAYSVPVSAKKA